MKPTTTQIQSAKRKKNLFSSVYILNTLLFCLCLLFFATASKGQWNQVGFDINGQEREEYSGSSVSMPNVNTVAIGAPSNNLGPSRPGLVRIYQRNGSQWVQKGNDIIGETNDDRSGATVSMPDANTVAIGAPENDGNGNNSGHVRIYQWTGTTWVQKGNDLDGESALDLSGWSVSMPDANTVAIGAPDNDGNGLNSGGHVRIYLWTGTTWVQKGSDIDAKTSQDNLGQSVSMPDANTVAIGAPSSGGNARIYQWSGTTWIQKGSDIRSVLAFNFFGSSISMPDANTVAVGAPRHDNDKGTVRIYEWSGSEWQKRGNDIDGENDGDLSSVSIDMPDANTIAIGSQRYRFDNIGHVRVFQWSGSEWNSKGSSIEGESQYDLSGIVSMPDPNTVAIGAPDNSGISPFGIDVGHVRIFSYDAVSTGPELERATKRLKLYPNPAKNNFTVELNLNEINQPILFYDLQGKLIHEQSLLQKQEQIDTENWKAGVYFVRYGEEIQKLVILE